MLRESRACDTLQLTLHILELLRWVSGPFGCLCPTLGARAAEAANRFLHKPWEAPADVLKAAGVDLGETYPFRCVSDLKGARQLSADAVVDMRRGIISSAWNDAEGYDVISLPGGELTKVFTRREFRLPRSDAPKPRSRKRSPRRSASRSRSKVARRACQQSLASWVLRDPGRNVIDLDTY